MFGCAGLVMVARGDGAVLPCPCPCHCCRPTCFASSTWVLRQVRVLVKLPWAPGWDAVLCPPPAPSPSAPSPPAPSPPPPKTPHPTLLSLPTHLPRIQHVRVAVEQRAQVAPRGRAAQRRRHADVACKPAGKPRRRACGRVSRDSRGRGRGAPALVGTPP